MIFPNLPFNIQNKFFFILVVFKMFFLIYILLYINCDIGMIFIGNSIMQIAFIKNLFIEVYTLSHSF